MAQTLLLGVGRRPRRPDGSRRSDVLLLGLAAGVAGVANAAERALPPVAPVRTVLVGARRLLPQVVEFDHLRRLLVRQLVAPYTAEVLAVLAQPFDEAFLKRGGQM